MIQAELRWPLRVVPVVRVAGRFPLDDRDFAYTYRQTRHALHLYEYGGRLQMGRREIVLEPGDVTLSVAGGVTRYDLPEPGHHWCIHFDPVTTRGESVTLPLHLRLAGRRHHGADRMAEIARLHRADGKPLADARAGLMLQDLLLWLAGLRDAAQPEGRSAQAVSRLLAVLDQRFSETLTVPQLAELAGVTQDVLSRRFRQRTGMTIPRYLLQRRMAHARYLLESTDLPIKRVAERVGMPDPQHFNKQFRLVTGLSPSAAREAHAAQQGLAKSTIKPV
jgi:AraC-like DNA-binding protein